MLKKIISAVLILVMLIAVFPISAFSAEKKYVQVTASSVNIRKGAGIGYAKTGVVYKGEKYEYLSSKKASNGVTWYKIQYNASKTAWIISKYSKIINAETASTTTAKPTTTTAGSSTTVKSTTKSTTNSTAAAVIKKVKITGSVVNVRKSAGTKYSVITTVKKNSTYVYTATKKVSGKTWYKITVGKKTGWVIGTYAKAITVAAPTTTTAKPTTTTTKPTTTKQTTETTAATTKSTTASVASTTTVTTTVESSTATSPTSAAETTTSNTTAATTASGTDVDPSGSTTVPTESTTTVTTTTTTAVKNVEMVTITGSPVNVRSGAGSNYSKIGSAKKGNKYKYLGTKTVKGRAWYKIQFTSSKTGWVTSQFSKKITVKAEAEKPVPSDAQSYVNSIAKSYGADGIQVALIDDGVVKGVYNYGYATKKSSKMTSDHKIRVASISKVAVSVCAMKLQEQGKVNINTKIGTYWGANLPKAVTLKSLLSHTSTLRFLGYSSTKAGTLSQLKKSGNYTGGTVGASSSWIYNNYAVGVAGSTLEVAAKTTMNKYAKSNVFAPLGMDAAFNPGAVNDTSKLATLYYAGGSVARSVSKSKSIKGSSVPGNNTSAFAGGLTCSAKDLAKMIAMLANDGTYNGVQILTPESVQTIEKQLFKKSEYGGSFHQCMPLRYKANLYGESSLYYHTGNAYGVLALASYNPDTKDGVVVVTTGASASRDSQGVYAVCSKITQYMYKNVI